MSSSQPTQHRLGEVMQQNNVALARAEQLGIDAATGESALEHREKERTVRHFFDAAWDQFSTNILMGKAAGDVELGHKTHRSAHSALEAYQWRLPPAGWQAEGSKGIWVPGHAFHFLWLEFLAKCTENGLVPVWQDAHDGVGIESWVVLRVEVDRSAVPTAQQVTVAGERATVTASAELDSDLNVRLKLNLGLMEASATLSAAAAEALGTALLARAKQARKA